MSSRGEQIMVAVKAALETADGLPAGLTVERSRMRELDENATLPVALVKLGANEVVDYDTNVYPQVIRTRTFNVIVFAHCDPDDVPETVLDDLHQWVVANLAGNTFGGLAFETREQLTEWFGEASLDSVAGFDMTFSVRYLTHEADETSVG
jgi:hypothetical protein